jgi:hypothetical protein
MFAGGRQPEERGGGRGGRRCARSCRFFVDNTDCLCCSQLRSIVCRTEDGGKARKEIKISCT